MSKTVSQLDQNGFFLCYAEADESPLEEGVFHIPAGCVEVVAPGPLPGKRQHFVGGQFEYVDIIVVTPPAPPPPAPPEPELPAVDVEPVQPEPPVYEPVDPPSLDQIKAALVEHVDTVVAEIYVRWTRFQGEYELREAAARAFREAAYEGDPGIWVTSFSEPSGYTGQQAADLIITQADALRTALERLAAQRMRKYGIVAPDATEQQAHALHDDIVREARAIATGI